MWRKTALPKGHEGDFARRSIEFWNRTLRNILYIWVVFTKGLLYYENRIALRLFSSIFDLCLSITNHNWKEIKSDCMGVVVSKNVLRLVQKTRATLSTNQLAALSFAASLIIRVFPRFEQCACFHSESSLANDDVNLCFDWSLGLLCFWFFDTKTAL